ncbi:MAG: sulfotransferase [Cellvibrionaceae bacterium]|nr:sulfotransferase [Cellvibrionaceae bacterium]
MPLEKKTLPEPSLLSVLWLALRRIARLPLWAWQSLNQGGWSVRRAAVLMLTIPLLMSWQIINWCFILLDELLLPGWRKTPLSKPWFIVGIPRSGTTFLQRSLAKDRAFTTTPLWEALLAPALSQKYLLWGLAWCLAPLWRKLRGVKLPFLKQMSAIHELGLQEAEEDFLFLLPMNACFILVALLPDCEDLFKLAHFDVALQADEKQRIMVFYRNCIKKHLYFRAHIESHSQLVYLAKNPSLSPAVLSLQGQFPDARFIACLREPEKTLPSQISSLKPAFGLSGYYPSPEFVESCIVMLHFYYQHLNQVLARQPNAVFVAMSTLKNDLYRFVTQTYKHFSCEMSSDSRAALCELAQSSSNYRSEHRYKLSDFGLSEQQVKARFEEVWPITQM